MVERVIEWFKGYIYIEVISQNISRFLNVCGARKIVFFSVIYKDDKAVIKLRARDYFKVYEVGKKCDVKISIKKKIGFPFFIKLYRKEKCA